MRWIVNKGLLVISSLTLSMGIGFAGTVDVYGLSQNDANKILKKYAKEVAEMEPAIIKETVKQDPDADLSAPLKKLLEKKYGLLQEITKKNGFNFVDFQTVFYPDNSYATTIEIIDKQHPERMRFVSAMPLRTPVEEQSPEKKGDHKPDVVDAMTKYTYTIMHMFMRHEISPIPKCSAYHCLGGFDNPKLKPYLAMFNEGAIKDKKLILETLRHDKNAERRASAAFLVGYFKNPHEILSVLAPSVADKNEGVRNDVMRVIGSTVDKSKINDFDVRPFLDALDSPYVTDRNKALYVLNTAVDNVKSKKIVIKEGGGKLLALMELKQPNNHDFAYIILKKISGKDFGSANVAAWKKWVASAQSQMA